MPDRFYIDPPALRGDAADLRRSGARLKAAVTKLTGVLDDHHGCWGTDDIGKAFAKNYTPSETELREGGKSTVENITIHAEGIEANTKAFEGVDHANAQRMDRAPREK